MDKISIIVPVYNVAPTIRKCLDSIINQTFDNLEILLIDDGSTDGCGKICDEYSQNDSRVRVFHKENGGLSSALNVGLRNFTGDHIGFIDSDDWLEPDMYEALYSLVKQYNISIGVVNYFIDTDSGSVARVNKEKVPEGVLSQKEMLTIPLKRDYYYGFSGYVWNKLWSAEIFRNNDFSFDENIGFGMDMLFYYTVVVNGKCNGAYSEEPYYHYYQRSSSISFADPEKNTDALIVYQRIINILESNGFEDLSIWAKRYYCYFGSLFAEYAILRKDSKTLTEMKEKMKLYLNEYLVTNREFPDRINRIAGLLDG